jgi:hypothetical protein
MRNSDSPVNTNGFFGLQLCGFIILVFYCHLTAIVLDNVIHSNWVYWIVFCFTELANWKDFVIHISQRFVLSRFMTIK